VVSERAGHRPAAQWDFGMAWGRLGWQPSRFLTDRVEAERAFQLAEELGSINAAAAELGITWPSLRKAFTRHGLGMPARNPRPSASGPSPPPASAAARRPPPTLDPVFVALNPGALPARERPAAELHEWVRREEQYATLGANVVVELYSESDARQPHHPRLGDRPPGRPQPPARRPTHQPPRLPPHRPHHSHRPPKPVPPIPGAGAGGRCPLTPAARPTRQRAAFPRLLSTLMSPGSWPEAPLGYASFEHRSP
jgi:hypothetical protein